MVILTDSRRHSPLHDGAATRTLRLDDIPTLGLDWRHRLDRPAARSLVRTFPGRSAIQPATGQFAFVGPWRHRRDVVQLVEVRSWRESAAVVDHAAAQAGELGADLMVVVENDERRRPGTYRDLGLDHLEDVITMDLDEPVARPRPAGGLRFVPVRPGSPDLPAVRLIDDLAFPWLWRNGPAEFAAYLRMSDVRVFLGFDGDDPVSYFGVTVYHRWGHLDRIAVRPDLQGRGLGSETLHEAIGFLAAQGARSIGLSTQAHNRESRRLYERAGFRWQPDNDYRIYGRALRDEPIDALLARPAVPTRIDAEEPTQP